MNLIRSDLDFILAQIIRAETNAPLQSPDLPFGLRTVDGIGNNAVPGQSEFGSADRVFPRMTDPVFRDAENFDSDGAGPAPATPTSYNYLQTSGPAHQRLGPKGRDGLEDWWKPTIQLNEEQAVAVRELDPTAYLSLKHDQLLP
jgi:hypothetical protein